MKVEVDLPFYLEQKLLAQSMIEDCRPMESLILESLYTTYPRGMCECKDCSPELFKCHKGKLK